MRILLVSQYFWPESFRINDIVALLRTQGGEVTVLTGQPNYPKGAIFDGYRALGFGRDWREHGYEVYRLPILPRGDASGLRLFLNYASFISSGVLLGPWLLRRRSFDVIFVYGTSPIFQAVPAILLKWIKGRPLVIWVQDLWPQSLEATGHVRNRLLLALVGKLTSWVYRRADLILGQSQSFVRTLTPMSAPTPVMYFPTPGDVDGELTAAPPLPNGFSVVFAGNLGTAQALPTVVEAASLLQDHPEIKIVLVGDGSLRQWLLEEVERRKLRNVVLLGRLPASSMPALLSQASVLLASLGKSEILAQTIPAKISTYLKMGRPIIASMDGEGGEVIATSGGGIACAAENADALAEAILQIYRKTPDERAAMGAAGIRHFEANFEPQALTARLMTILRDVTSVRRT